MRLWKDSMIEFSEKTCDTKASGRIEAGEPAFQHGGNKTHPAKTAVIPFLLRAFSAIIIILPTVSGCGRDEKTPDGRTGKMKGGDVRHPADIPKQSTGKRKHPGSPSARAGLNLRELKYWTCEVEKARSRFRKGAPDFRYSPDDFDDRCRRQIDEKRLLKEVFGAEITDREIAAEIERINIASQAPAVLQAMRDALGNDRKKFAEVVVEPQLVDKRIRELFSTDNRLQSERREVMKKIDNQLREKGFREVGKKFSGDPGTGKFVRYDSGMIFVAGGNKPVKPVEFELVEPLLSEFRAALKKPGDLSPVLEVEKGWMIFRLNDSDAQTGKYVVSRIFVKKLSFEEWFKKRRME